jgi:cytochrome c553
VTSTEDAGATASATDAGAPPATAAPTPKSWDDLSHDEKLALMKNQVLPKMKEAFQAYDSKDFADFTCVTCHGPDAKKGKFDMPNPKLPKLDFKAGLKKAMAKHPKMVKFMHETVVPQMATMLGEQPYDPATGKGFGCAECHTSSD